MDNWIRREDALPEIHFYVWLWDGKNIFGPRLYEGDTNFDLYTHWQYCEKPDLPELHRCVVDGYTVEENSTKQFVLSVTGGWANGAQMRVSFCPICGQKADSSHK